MMAAAPGQNATVEEILASIRQAISDDDAKRTNERLRSDPKSLAEKKPVASVTNVFGEKKVETEPVEAAAPAPETEAGELAAAEALADQEFIEQAIEQALDGVRAELEAVRPAAKAGARPQVESRAVEVAAVAGGGQRAVPRARAAGGGRKESAPRKALMSPRADASVAASFEDLSKAMLAGNSRKLDEVVEELLRPMLKGWLESNLPQMVERLVREEIERVSRGRP
jgi:cell pole-organizing protein PopZ